MSINPVALCVPILARLAAGLFVLPVVIASGQTVVSSNLGNTPHDSYFVGGNIGPYWAAGSFTTGSSASTFSLAAVTLLIGTPPAPSYGGTNGGFSVWLYDDSSSQPGSALTTLSGSANPATAGLYPYTASGVTLNASTTYWIVAQAGINSAYSWSGTNDYSEAGWIISDLRAFSTTSGVAWSVFGSNDVQQFSVSVAAIPEPASVGLMIGSLALALGVWCRKRI